MWELKYNDKRLFLPEEPKPTWPNGQLGEVGKLNVLATRQIAIPRSPVSDTFFEYVGLLNSTSRIVRESATVALLYNKQVVIANAVVTNFKVDKRRYTLILASDVRLLINKLDGNLSELDFDDIRHAWNSTSMAAGLVYDELTSDFVYARTAYDNQGNTSDTHLLPLLSFRRILAQIAADSGLSITDNSSVQFQDLEDWKRSYFQCTTRRFATLEPEQIAYTGPATEYATSGTYIVPLDVDTFEGVFFQASPLDNGVFVNQRTDLDFVIYLDVSAAGAGWVASLLKTGAGADVRYTITAATGGNRFRVPAADVNIGDLFQIEIVAGVTDVPLTIEVTQFDATATATYIGDGALYDFAPNLPDIKQIDFIKFVANRYALFVDYDPETETMYLSDYGADIDFFEAGLYTDLSSKLVNADEIGIDYVGDYAQNNKYSYTNEAPTPETEGEGTLVFDNPNAQIERTSYKAPFGVAATYGNGTVMPYVEADGATLRYVDSFKPVFTQVHRPVVDPYTGFLIGIPGTTNYTTNVNGLGGAFATSWQYAIDTYYPDFASVLADLRIVSADAYLNYEDVKAITAKAARYPVYLNTARANGVFRVNEVGKFRPDGYSSLELTKIGTPQLKALPIYQGYSADAVIVSGKVFALPNSWPRGTAPNFLQTVAANQPTLSPSGGIEFDGGDWLTQIVPARTLSQYTHFQWIYMVPPNGRTLTQRVFSDYSPTPSNGMTVSIENVSGQYRVRAYITKNGAAQTLETPLLDEVDFVATYCNRWIPYAVVLDGTTMRFHFDWAIYSRTLIFSEVLFGEIGIANIGTYFNSPTLAVESGTRVEGTRSFDNIALTPAQIEKMIQKDIDNLPHLTA